MDYLSAYLYLYAYVYIKVKMESKFTKFSFLEGSVFLIYLPL